MKLPNIQKFIPNFNNILNISLHDHYELREVIGKGSYGTVFKGKRKSDSKLVAIKKFSKVDFCNLDSHLMGTIREMNILQYLKHDNIVEFIDFFVNETVNPNFYDIFVVIEYCPHDLYGLSHLSQIRGNPLGSEAVSKYIVQKILEALIFLHSQNIVHRDIKPSNVLILNDGGIKLADFSLARAFNRDTNNGVSDMTPNCVTAAYRAPEIFNNQKYTEKVDIWSVGVILAGMIFDDDIFEGKSELEILSKIHDYCLDSNKRLRENAINKVGNSLAVDLVCKLLELNPNSRPSAAEALNHEWFRVAPVATKPNVEKYHDTHEATIRNNNFLKFQSFLPIYPAAFVSGHGRGKIVHQPSSPYQ
eukprot:TRINITY_DN1456_c0_g1_i1.p1 TRINITY_DN1456_c0_g1~~TRINITY_DN1456_c0_g1_i1.p1  ORF type:complete len:361 (+),score=87.17 TRINITY_DN1456_c0_g1_i1:51-1133(+)